MPLTFYLEESQRLWYLDIEKINPIIATIYEGLMGCHRCLAVITMVKTSHGGPTVYEILLDDARVVCNKS